MAFSKDAVIGFKNGGKIPVGASWGAGKFPLKDKDLKNVKTAGGKMFLATVLLLAIGCATAPAPVADVDEPMMTDQDVVLMLTAINDSVALHRLEMSARTGIPPEMVNRDAVFWIGKIKENWREGANVSGRMTWWREPNPFSDGVPRSIVPGYVYVRLWKLSERGSSSDPMTEQEFAAKMLNSGDADLLLAYTATAESVDLVCTGGPRSPKKGEIKSANKWHVVAQRWIRDDIDRAQGKGTWSRIVCDEVDRQKREGLR